MAASRIHCLLNFNISNIHIISRSGMEVVCRWLAACSNASYNKPDTRKCEDLSCSHRQLLYIDQPPKKRVFMRLIAWVSMISGLLSFVLPFIFEFVSRLFRYMTPIDFLVIPSGPVAALVGVALGLLS